MRRIRGVIGRRKPLEHVPLRLYSAATPIMQKHPCQTYSTPSRNYVKMFDGSELDDTDPSSSRTSTPSDINEMVDILRAITESQNIASRSWLAEEKIKTLCLIYQQLENSHKNQFIVTLASDFGVDSEKVNQCASNLLEGAQHNPASVVRLQENLRGALAPQYAWLFKRIGRLENGVKFLVDFRADIINCLRETLTDSPHNAALQQLNSTLRDLLAMWFSVGFLRLERVTWRSSCEMLQKISEYEAVHPVRSWADIKRRVGQYRRCFVFTHASMEGEPLVVLHTALCDAIPATLAAIVNSRARMSVSAESNNGEDEDNIRAGVFYSITSTQRGLQGIDLGNYLIKKVVRELQAEFPNMTEFATLSPIPNFKQWFLDKIKSAERGNLQIFTQEEMGLLRELLPSEDFWLEFKRFIKNNTWVEFPAFANALELPLLRLCARYLYAEKRRNMALCSVGNFHLSNGAMIWRINWKADLSVRGLNNSCGIMVNYRYFLNETERNSEQYLGDHVIEASEEVRSLSSAAESLTMISKL